jgi:hypothetical protein
MSRFFYAFCFINTWVKPKESGRAPLRPGLSCKSKLRYGRKGSGCLAVLRSAVCARQLRLAVFLRRFAGYLLSIPHATGAALLTIGYLAYTLSARWVWVCKLHPQLLNSIPSANGQRDVAGLAPARFFGRGRPKGARSSPNQS